MYHRRMYLWRRLSDHERAEALLQRQGRGLPWHRPPHLDFEGPATFIITAACYEHRHIVGASPRRIADFEHDILDACEVSGANTSAWCILPNHYHLLARTDNIKALRKEIGKVHGRTARGWNLEDRRLGRKVWFNFFDRDMKSSRHYWASLNYIHNNAVHHGYVERWQDWPYSSVHQFLEAVGRDEAQRIWLEYPVLDYGKGWDIY
jgi:putative transposase